MTIEEAKEILKTKDISTAEKKARYIEALNLVSSHALIKRE